MASPHGHLTEARTPTAGASPSEEERPRTPETADVKTANREGSYSSTTEAPLPYDESPPLPDEPVRTSTMMVGPTAWTPPLVTTTTSTPEQVSASGRTRVSRKLPPTPMELPTTRTKAQTIARMTGLLTIIFFC
ncbi:hypothetical protein P3342_008564 [Pyrenophora teres f. teres]|nr:hypothetical protein P3342_008564 [Pyrenophora teres f. teres]